MFSTNKNIESLCELASEVREYLSLRLEGFRLDFVSKLTVLLSAMVLGSVLLVFMAIVLLFLSYTVALALASAIGNEVAAFALVALAYLLLGGVVYAFRRPLIVQPLTNFIAGLFLDTKEDDKENDEEEQP